MKRRAKRRVRRKLEKNEICERAWLLLALVDIILKRSGR